mmetsp:Transcript_47482/g.78580  ORF Transcript_47482/g.78580 Transcript_47482/m.78580 type:complete len:838 (+) Transcript_47482:50-2563(+)
MTAVDPSVAAEPKKPAQFFCFRPKVLVVVAVLAVVVAAAMIAISLILIKKHHDHTEKSLTPEEASRELAMQDAQLLARLRLAPYDSCRSLARSLQLYPGSNYGEHVSLSSRYDTGYQPVMLMEPEIMMMALDSAGSSGGATRAAGSSKSADSYSSTNVQVKGIDESDIVKNDGAFIYSVGGSQLVIVRAYPSDERGVVSRTSLRADGVSKRAEVFAAEEALLDADTLLIFSAAQVTHAPTSRRVAAVIAQAWNVTDRAAPRLLAASTIEGSLVTSRLIGGFAYVAISSAAHLSHSPAPMPTDEDVMPLVWHPSILGDAAPVTACDDVSYISDVQPRSLVTLASIALTDPAHAPGTLVSRKTLATGSSWREAAVFASANSVYVATYNSEWKCEPADGSISGCGADEWWCIDRRRLRHTSSWWREECSYSVATYIVAFTVEAGAITQRARGAVPGYLLSQWALDEHAGHLRVAYTRPQGISLSSGARTAQTDNAVDVLAIDDLRLVGRVRGLGQGERIYAMRFIGSRGYMVTFREVDPLYTLDFDEPTKPRVLGELKIPGYSDYLHPIDATTLLGVGKAGNDAGAIRGVKLALFDLSDVFKPSVKGEIELGGSDSHTAVSDDHKALLFDPKSSLLVIPITERVGWQDVKPSGESACEQPPTFHGAKVFTLDEAGFSLRAAIEHSPHRSHTKAFPEGGECACGGCCASTPCASAMIRRSLYIGDDLYTISDGEVRATSLTSFTTGEWGAPLLEREVLVREGACSLEDVPLSWQRVAASGKDIYCNGLYSPCRPADWALRDRECSSNGRRSFEALLNCAVAPCGNMTCVEEVRYNPCSLWF